jgi:O-antigen ligase
VKWVGLALLLAAISPLSGWLRRNPLQAPKIWLLVGLLPYSLYITHLVVSFASTSDGATVHYVHGAEFSVLDAVAIALYCSLPKRGQSLPFLFAIWLYFFAVSLSVLPSIYPMATLFYLWQLARMFLVYAVVARGCADPRVAPAILTGMAVGLLVQAITVVWQHFGQGIHQAPGTFLHQNLLGLISHFVVFPFFALVLAGRGGRLALAVVLSGAVVELLTASRATVGLAALGYTMVFFLSAIRKWTSRKAQVLLFGAAALAVLVPVSIASIQQRGDAELGSSDDERVAMQIAAQVLIADHPFGVGANNYVSAANMDGANQAAGVDWTSNTIFVHNAYLLITAETGYFGLISFALLLLSPMIAALRCSWRERKDPSGDILLGIGVALLITYIHAAFEFVFLLDQTQYMLAIEFGMIAGLGRQLGYWGRPRTLDVPPGIGSLSTGPARGTIKRIS